MTGNIHSCISEINFYFARIILTSGIRAGKTFTNQEKQLQIDTFREKPLQQNRQTRGRNTT